MFASVRDKRGETAKVSADDCDLPFLLTVPHADGEPPHWRPDIKRDSIWKHHIAGSHHALDRGAAKLGRALQSGLQRAEVIEGEVSRLVIDLNRPLESGEAIPQHAGKMVVPFNTAIRPGDIAARRFGHQRFHRAIADKLRDWGGRAFLIDMHSFDRTGDGVFLRDVDIGICAPEDDRFASLVLAALHADPGCAGLRMKRDEPYSAAHPGAYITRRHQKASAGCTVIETCDDLLSDNSKTTEIASLLQVALCRAANAIASDRQSDAEFGENQ